MDVDDVIHNNHHSDGMQLSPVSVQYSDMHWSPIPTQSTLNNWYMLTQSLTEDLNGEPTEALVSDVSDPNNSNISAESNADCGAIENQFPADCQSSPDMFAESPVIEMETMRTECIEVAKISPVIADYDVDMGQQSSQTIRIHTANSGNSITLQQDHQQYVSYLLNILVNFFNLFYCFFFIQVQN